MPAAKAAGGIDEYFQEHKASGIDAPSFWRQQQHEHGQSPADPTASGELREVDKSVGAGTPPHPTHARVAVTDDASDEEEAAAEEELGADEDQVIGWEQQLQVLQEEEARAAERHAFVAQVAEAAIAYAKSTLSKAKAEREERSGGDHEEAPQAVWVEPVQFGAPSHHVESYTAHLAARGLQPLVAMPEAEPEVVSPREPKPRVPHSPRRPRALSPLANATASSDPSGLPQGSLG